jgi:hypothetical protein
MKNLFRVLIRSLWSFGLIAVIGANSGCSKSDTPSSPVQTTSKDLTTEIVTKVGIYPMALDSSSLAITPDGTFEMLFDSYVRYYPSRETIATEVHCLLKVGGRVEFQENDATPPHPQKSLGIFSVDRAEVLSARYLENRGDARDSQQICSGYAKGLVQTKVYRQSVFDYGPAYLAFVQIRFDVARESGGWLYNGHLMSDVSHGSVRLRRDDFRYHYFIRPNVEIEIREMVMRDLAGSYVYQYSEKHELNISEKQNFILFSSPKCGLVYRLDVTSITISSKAIQLRVTPNEISGFPATEYGLNCTGLENDLRSLGQNSLLVEYSTGVDRDQKPSKSLRLSLNADKVSELKIMEFNLK